MTTLRHVLFLLIALGLGCQPSNRETNKWHMMITDQGLDNWEIVGDPSGFAMDENMIRLPGKESFMIYKGSVYSANFKNFEWRAQVMVTEGGKSGVYFHTDIPENNNQPKGYLVHIFNGIEPGSDHRKTGSLFGIRENYKNLVADNEWFDLHILVKGNRVQVFVNDIMTVDYSEPNKVVREPHLASKKLSSGTFSLLGSDKPVYIRNMAVKPLPDQVDVEPGTDYFTPEKAAIVDKLIGRGYPVVDYHVHMKGGVTLEDILDKSRRTGIFCSLAPNCGIGFPIETNDQLEAFYQEYKDVPIFLAMQAEGREWVHTFEKASIAKYDYVFTDAMTFSGRSGNRMRLWINEEVEIGDPQDFMELLVSTIEDVLDNEKIDIYANATFLPEEIQDRYDELWTQERIDRLIDALARNDIALEISARYEIPSASIINKAREKGIKFAFGTNNSDHDYANLDYCFRMIEECGIEPGEIFIPRPDGMKPVQVR